MWLSLKVYIAWEITDILLLTFISFGFLDSQNIITLMSSAEKSVCEH